MATEIVLPRRYGLVVGMFLAGVLFVFAGVFELGRVSAGAEVFFFALGAPLVIANGRILIVRSPRLRATEAGLWFGGGATIPWREVKQFYEANTNVRMHGVTTRTIAIAIDFERKRTLFRLPMTLWFAAPFSTGDVDVSPAGASGSTAAIVARLETMRGAARAA